MKSFSKLFSSFNERFVLPKEFREDVVNNNIKYIEKFSLILSLFGFCWLLITFFADSLYDLKRKAMLCYYACFAFGGMSCYILLKIVKKASSYSFKDFCIFIAQALGYVNCILLAYIPETPLINSLIFFCVESIICIIVFNIQPVVNVCIDIFVLSVLADRGIDIGYDCSYFNFIDLLITMGILSFYKRYIFIRDLRQAFLLKSQNAMLENQKEELEVQKQELSSQKESLLHYKDILEDEISFQALLLNEKNRKLLDMRDDTIIGLSNLVEKRDEETGNHVLRTSMYVKALAEEAYRCGFFQNEIDPLFIENISKAAPLHDIGKIVIPDSVLKKPACLTFDEFELIKPHTVEGERIIENIFIHNQDEEYVRIAKEIASSHHEKYNGKGYPKGLKGDEIPLSARIMAIADVFDALVHPRCYKQAMPFDDAFKIIEDGSNEHFDPLLVRLFIKIRPKIEEYLS